MTRRIALAATICTVAAVLAVWVAAAQGDERAVYVNGVRGTLLQGIEGGRSVINDFVPRNSYARAAGPPLRLQTPGDATWVMASLGRGSEHWIKGGTPSQIAAELPSDAWDWMVLQVSYGPSRDEQYAWRFADNLGNGFLTVP